MNDLERDLKELFESKAGDVQTTPLAPKAVLRRGRRRQVGTVVGGALMGIAVAAVVIGGASAFLGDRAETPPMGTEDVLPTRTATIGGVTVTAPEGWSLLDQSIWSMAIATETCTSTFEGTATPVGPGAGEGDAAPVETPPTVEEKCTPVDLPAGLPLFTLANVEPNPTQTVCEVIPELSVQSVGPTDAYLYVAFDPAPGTSATWPVSLETVLPGSCGTNLMAEWTVGGVGYLAAAAFGPEVSDADRQAVLDAFAGLSSGGSPPQMAASPVIGFVVATGVQDDVTWRLEAGTSMTCESGGACAVQIALITTDPDGAEESFFVSPPTPGSSIVSAMQPVGRTTIAFGAAASDVETIEIVTGDGTTVTPTSVPWPTSLQTFASPDVPVDGTIWWASVPDVVSVDAVLTDGTTASSGVGEPSGTPAAPSATESSSVVRFAGEDQGVAWSAKFGLDEQGRLCLTTVIDGVAASRCDDEPSFTFPADDWLPPPRIAGGVALAAGTLPSGFVSIQPGDGLDGSNVRAECLPGPAGAVPDRYACVVVLPPSGQATLLFIGEDPTLVIESPIEWGDRYQAPPAAEPTTAQVTDGIASLTAESIRWSVGTIQAPSGQPFTIEIANRDAGVPHNFVVFGQDGETRIAETEIETGPIKQRVEVPALAPGTYPFRCDVHPTTMVGEIVVG